VDRALGKVPNVAKAHWDWRNQIGWVKFEEGKTPDMKAVRKALFDAVNVTSEFTADSVTFYESVDELHNEVR